MRFASLYARVAGRVRHVRVRRSYVVAAAAVFAVYLLFGWLALPGILQSQAEKYVLERSGHHLTMDRPSFNPLTLSLRLKNLRLTEPDGAPLLSFKSLLVDFSMTSLFRRAYVFDAIRLDGLHAAVAALPKDRLNWSAFLDAFRSNKKSSELPRVIVDKFTLTGGRLDLADRRSAVVRSTRLAPLAIELTDLSTLPNAEGRYEISARTGFGARIHWDGLVALKPMSISGSLRVDGLSLTKLATLMPLPPKLAAPQGMAALAMRYRAGMLGDRFDLRLAGLSLRINGFRLAAKSDPDASLAFDRVAISGGRFDLDDRRATVQSVAFSGGGVQAARDARGRINLLDLLPAPQKSVPAKTAAPAWHYRIARVSVQGFGVVFRDRPADFALQNIAAEVDNVSDDRAAPLPVRLSLQARDGGSFSASGTVVPATAAADLAVKLDGLVLTPLQPYLGKLTTLTLTSGALSGDGHVTYDGKSGQYAGSLALADLRIVEGGHTFLAWRSLATTTLTASPKRIAVRELLLDGLDTRILIAKDKSINLTKVLRKPAAAPAATPARASTGLPIAVHVGRLRFRGGQMDFADQSLALPFGTHIHALTGTLVNISSRPGAPARLALEGQIDNYGMARAQGRLDLFDPTRLLDVKVDFTNVEMTRLTPYSATFAGRRIASGKLTLNLEYKIDHRQLEGDNRIIMDQLTLGERVKSPQAMDLPLDLAIAILEDANGRIDLGLPVSGSLDDPQFSYGRIVWKAIVNVITKIVTSPFRALGALFGGDDKFDSLVFEPGRPSLTPPQREALVHFATALGDRPNLAVTLHGTWSEADRAALKDLALRKQLAGKLGLSTQGDPGLITPDQPKVKPALKDLYASRFGDGALAALENGFRKSNPGKLGESTGGKLMSVFTGLIGTKPDLSAKDVAAMKGTDFYTLLYDKLRDAEDVTDAQLEALATARAADVMTELRAAKAPLDRITLAAPVKVDAQDGNVPLKMDMAPVANPVLTNSTPSQVAPPDGVAPQTVPAPAGAK